VINYPKRGIGDTTVDRIIVAADKHQITPFEVIMNAGQICRKSAGITAQLLLP
jgi:DNA helicase-2/ATP-dependent DNA helicase PcrA